MYQFLQALGEHPFLQYALAAGLLSSIACGVVGSYVAARRITYMAGGIAHCVLGGLGVARYCQVVLGWQWLTPVIGAAAASLLAAVIIGLVTLRWREREDTVISALWAVGMATGVLFIWHTPGYNENLMSYLFGNILMVGGRDLWLLAALDVVVVFIGLAFYNQFLAICLDEEFARLRGINVEVFYLLLLCLTALTVVLLTMVVGLVMVIALLSLPVAIGARFCRSLGQVMLVAVLSTMALTCLGLVIGYTADLPMGATTIMLAGAAYLLAHGLAAGLTALRRRSDVAASPPPDIPQHPS